MNAVSLDKHTPVRTKSNDDNSNANVKKAQALIIKQINNSTCAVHHTFWYISLPSLLNYEWKRLNFTLSEER